MNLSRKKITLKTLIQMKKDDEAVSFVTAYDYPSACFAEAAGIDMILVGDSGGMTTLGYKNTIPVTMDEMMHFAKAVCRGVKATFVVGDMPFMSYQISDRDAVRNAARFMSEAGCDAIKLEGGVTMYDRIDAIRKAGIPVMAHLGLTPQSLSLQGGYRVWGKNVEELRTLISDARAVQDAGASFILLEAIPEDCAAIIRNHVKIPVYGIGAGKKLDGQLLILHDLIGAFVGDVKPKFAKAYAQVGNVITEALCKYRYDVRQRFFPSSEHTYSVTPHDLHEIQSVFGGDIAPKSPDFQVPSAAV